MGRRADGDGEPADETMSDLIAKLREEADDGEALSKIFEVPEDDMTRRTAERVAMLRAAADEIERLREDFRMGFEVLGRVTHLKLAAQEENERLKEDKARLDWLDAEADHSRAQGPVAALTVKADYDRNSSEWVNIVGTAREAIDAARSELIPATDDKSCDNCQSQEGRHYCLLHSRQVKNMDTVRCKDWEERSEPEEAKVQ